MFDPKRQCWFCVICYEDAHNQYVDLLDSTVFVCKCGFQKEIKTNLKDLNKSIQKKKNALKNNLIIISEKDKISAYPQVTKICPKCNYKIAETWQQQM